MSWEKKKFIDFILLQRGYDLTKKQIKDGIYPVVTSTSIMGYHYIYKVEGPGVITGRLGTIGEVQYVEENYWPHNTSLYVKNFKGNNPKFVYYFLKNFATDRVKTGSAVPTLNRNNLSDIEVVIPDIKTQCRIVNILSVYDDLIENNQKQIKLLEEAAQRLYKEWFVDLRFPGYEDVAIIDGVPEGWNITELANYCYVTDGTHESPKTKNQGVPLVTGKCIKNGYINFNEANLISEEDHDKIKIRSGLSTGDILFSNIGTVGSTCRVNYDRKFSVKNVIILKPNSNSQSLFLYCWINSKKVQDSFLSQTNGSSQQFIGLNSMRKYKLMIPEQKILSAFENVISPIYRRKDLLYLENLKLLEIRNRLLPKLMSGELEVL